VTPFGKEISSVFYLEADRTCLVKKKKKNSLLFIDFTVLLHPKHGKEKQSIAASYASLMLTVSVQSLKCIEPGPIQ